MENKENKTIFLEHSCYLEITEDPELVKYLYDKELERSKLIIEKATAAFFLFAVDSGFCIINWNNLYIENNASIILLIYTVLFLLATVIVLIGTFGFTTKINTTSNQKSTYNIKEIYEFLHDMNDKKEDLLDLAYICLAASIGCYIILSLNAQLWQKI